MRTSHFPPGRRGFTLVEMLVVVAIISILAAILVPTVARAVARAKEAAMALEISNLANAIEAYKGKFGDYPPDFSNVPAFQRHMQKAFPRHAYNLDPANANSWFNSYSWRSRVPTTPPKCVPATLDPGEALVFWLSAVKTSARTPLNIDNTHPNTAYAFDEPGDPVSFFDFDTSRLIDVDDDGWAEYAPKHAPDTPYVYFDGRLQNGGYIYNTGVYPSSGTNAHGFGIARPYRSNQTIDSDDTRTRPNDAWVGGSPNANAVNGTTWIEPGKFQILCAGQDNQFGTDLIISNVLVYKQFPDPNYTGLEDDLDNMASFSEGQTNEGAEP